ncbi:hypothetical protein OO015_13660 (plasmid) [Thermomicrobium sp. 4228-Ro]|uniref:hypothetical protein n=1 Tax=Thermomicrobium sp. 4228-Ro TaxID=2993937 RepID=UPI00224900C6|nr:hypothetical protein [Thermomicrobium sp. 4228-Ro]MCX2728531.1 hypothetical protein [Thermomicrobium sp. 4228-Ro]
MTAHERANEARDAFLDVIDHAALGLRSLCEQRLSYLLLDAITELADLLPLTENLDRLDRADLHWARVHVDGVIGCLSWLLTCFQQSLENQDANPGLHNVISLSARERRSR